MASTKNINLPNLPNLPNKKSKTFSFHFINLVRSTPHFSVFTFQFSVYRLVCLSKKNTLWDGSLTYSPKGITFRDRAKMLYIIENY